MEMQTMNERLMTVTECPGNHIYMLNKVIMNVYRIFYTFDCLVCLRFFSFLLIIKKNEFKTSYYQ